MIEFNFAQNFTLIALNAQDSVYLTTAKKISLRCMAAASILELYSNDEFIVSKDILTITKKDLAKSSITLYQETVLKAILGRRERLSCTLPTFLSRVTKLSKKHLKDIEHSLVDSLKGTDAIEEIPKLLGCDLLYHNSGVMMKEYRSYSDIYTRLVESLRAEILEDGAATDEAVIMLWLLRESGSLYDIFSRDELKLVDEHMSELFLNNNLAKQILTINIHKTIETTIKNFLRIKKDAMSTPLASGFNFIFPFLERSESVFIDTEAYFSNKEERLKDVKARLEYYGHNYTVIRGGTAPLIKIDNLIYEAIPHAVTQSNFPIHGVRLRRYPIYF